MNSQNGKMSLWPSPQHEFIARRKYRDSLYGFRCSSQNIYICALPGEVNLPKLLVELQSTCPVTATENGVLTISPANRGHICALINRVLTLLGIGLEETQEGLMATYTHPELWNVRTYCVSGKTGEAVLSGPHIILQNSVNLRYPLLHMAVYGPMTYNICQSDILLWWRLKAATPQLVPGTDLPISIVDPRFVYWKPLQEYVAAQVHPQRLSMLTEALDDALAKDFQDIY